MQPTHISAEISLNSERIPTKICDFAESFPHRSCSAVEHLPTLLPFPKEITPTFQCLPCDPESGQLKAQTMYPWMNKILNFPDMTITQLRESFTKCSWLTDCLTNWLFNWWSLTLNNDFFREGGAATKRKIFTPCWTLCHFLTDYNIDLCTQHFFKRHFDDTFRSNLAHFFTAKLKLALSTMFLNLPAFDSHHHRLVLRVPLGQMKVLWQEGLPFSGGHAAVCWVWV